MASELRLADFDQRARAAGADMHTSRDVADGYLLDVDVRLEEPVSARCFALPPTGVLVTDVSAEGSALAAEITFSSHSRITVTDECGWSKKRRLEQEKVR